MDGRAISFGPYRLLTAQRLLLVGDERVRLGGRAFDILAALVERAGKVVSKEELIACAWPTTFVEEASLKIQISALRRALGDGQGHNRYIATVVGRGYNFVARIREGESVRVSLPQSIAPTVLHNLRFRDNPDDWPRGGRDEARRAALAPAPGDGCGAWWHREDHSRPCRRRSV